MQKINLYEQIPHLLKDRLSFSLIAKIAGVFVVLLIALNIFARWQLMDYESQFRSLQLQQKAMTDELIKLNQAFIGVTGANSPADQLVKKKEIIDALLQQGLLNSSGFTEELEALAASIVSGVWLTEIQIQQGGKQISLTGKTLSMKEALLFLENLSNSNVFSGNDLELSKIGNPEAKTGVLQFTITTRQQNK